jgi:hypothetical protein
MGSHGLFIVGVIFGTRSRPVARVPGPRSRPAGLTAAASSDVTWAVAVGVHTLEQAGGARRRFVLGKNAVAIASKRLRRFVERRDRGGCHQAKDKPGTEQRKENGWLTGEALHVIPKRRRGRGLRGFSAGPKYRKHSPAPPVEDRHMRAMSIPDRGGFPSSPPAMPRSSQTPTSSFFSRRSGIEWLSCVYPQRAGAGECFRYFGPAEKPRNPRPSAAFRK